MINFLLRYPFCFPTLIAALFGVLFPVSTILFMLLHDEAAISWSNIKALHSVHRDLLIIWSAPFVLGFFGSYVGKTSWLLKQKMDSLQNRTTHLNTILDTAASAIITIDKTGAVLSFNRSAEHIFGFSCAEIVGQNISRLMPPEVASQHDNYIRRYLDTKQSMVLGKLIELKAQRKSGEQFPTLLQVNPMEIEGEMYFCGVIDDISETKALQVQLGQAQKLEAIGQLASGVAHEINTPIQYIGDNLSALCSNIADIIAYQQALQGCGDATFQSQLEALANRYDIPFILEDSPKAIHQAREGVERVAEIVKAMRTFSHVEAGLGKQTINLHDALNSALTICRNSYKYIADVETSYAEDVDSIECFANELNQVFLNLIINAAHAIEEKQAGMGLIRIVTRKMGDKVEVLIQDNGIGIPAEIQEKVFNLFFTTKPVGKGTGQGLSLAHSIVVEKHRGKLFFESTSEAGTTFHIQLPISSPDQA